MKMKALLLGVALASLSTMGAHAAVTFTREPEGARFNANLTPEGGPIAGQQQQLPLSQVGPEVVAVPEPATWALMLAGFGGLGVAIRSGRRKTRAAEA